MFLQQLVNGITIGSTYALVAMGFTIVFGVIELVNFANGQFFLCGAYFTLIFYQAMHGNFSIALILAIVLTGGVGFCMDRIVLRPLRDKGASKMSGMIATLGVATVIDNCIQVFIGSETKSFPNVLNFGQFSIGHAVVSWSQLIIFAVALIMMAIGTYLIYGTKTGKCMRCIAQNSLAAQLTGINVNGVISFAFVYSAIFACISGTLVGAYYQAMDLSMGSMVGLKTFASALLGGVGVLPGAILGGVMVGVVETIAASYISSGYRDAIAFGIMILVLLFRPIGFFGKKYPDKV
jgi:branched-chain amino acid transport system permease protein